MTHANMTIHERLTRAKIQMFRRSPFFSYIMTHLKFKEVTKDSNPSIKEVPTMGVDADGNLYWNKDWAEKLTENELIGALCHEAAHVALIHLERLGTRNPEVFNIANDLIVNDMLNQDGFDTPEGILNPDQNHTFEIPQINYDIKEINEKSSEEIYDEIYPLYPKIKVMVGCSGRSNGEKKGDKALEGFDKHMYGEGKGKDGKGSKERKRMWKKVVGEAAQIAKQRGKLPAGMERRIDGVLNAKINWKQELYQYVTSFIINDFSWNLPSRRCAALGIYLPRAVKESVKVVVSVDTSGSIQNEELKEFLGEMLGIGNSFPALNMDIIVVDAEVHETYKLTQNNIEDILSLKMSGGGGTNHIPVDKYIEENIQDCKVLINFTDGHTCFTKNGDELPYQTLWVINKNGCSEKDIPYGRAIKLRD